MNSDEYLKLDNPAWYSLSEAHCRFSIGNEELKFYQPEICPFGGLKFPDADLSIFIKSRYGSKDFFVIGEKPGNIPGIIIEKELVCLQMVCTTISHQEMTDAIIHLDEAHKKELIELVNLVQPGYFKEGTAEMGDYFGIFKDDHLVAVTGERMKMDSFTEISAVVTHPEFSGRGLAKQLVAHAVDHVFKLNKIAYLHVLETNSNAISLYEKLGFHTRRKISFWKMKWIKYTY